LMRKTNMHMDSWFGNVLRRDHLEWGVEGKLLKWFLAEKVTNLWEHTQSYTFWDIIPCGPSKVNRIFGENVASIIRIEEQVELCLLPAFTLVRCLAFPLALKMESKSSPKCRLTFNGLHSVISLKTEIFLTTVVMRTHSILLYFVV
jgi:hypothetical protein